MRFKYFTSALSISTFFVFSAVTFNYSSHSWAALQKLSLEELVGGSTLIVVGEVESLQSYWDEKGTIVTQVTITPERFITSSSKNNRIIVEIIGGEVGEIGLAVSTEPVFKTGEKSLLFLKKINNKENVYRVVNGEQGKIAMNANIESIIGDIKKCLRK